MIAIKYGSDFYINYGYLERPYIYSGENFQKY